jgi:two-component system alkaline phosphatase synthesis response regulator PhoP
MRLLLVDDDRFLLTSLRKLLQEHGFEVETAGCSQDALLSVAQNAPDLAVLDVSLPDFDGMTLCRRIRAKHRFPILMLTAKSDSTSKVVGLELGADDYLCKPFDPSELIARIRALLRRSNEYASLEQAAELIEIGDLSIDVSAREAFLNGEPLKLTFKEFELLAHLANNRGRVVSRAALFERNWGLDLTFDSNSLDVHVYRLRKKLEVDPANPRYLHTIKGFGFRLQDAS